MVEEVRRRAHLGRVAGREADSWPRAARICRHFVAVKVFLRDPGRPSRLGPAETTRVRRGSSRSASRRPRHRL